MLFGNEDETGRSNNNEYDSRLQSDDDLDYLYGQAPERPIYARSEKSPLPAPTMAVHGNTVLDREGQVETQSGFMLVFKGSRDKASLSVRRKVGTPPATAVTLTPDELRRLTNLISELMPEPESREVLAVGAARQVEQSVFGTDLDSFVASEYPELAMRRRKRQTQPSKILANKKVLIASAVAVVALLAAGGSLLNSRPFAHPAPAQNTAPSVSTDQVEALARDFVSDMLDFKAETYRQSQIKAMAMMTPDLSARYWQETHFPLSAAQLKRMPNQELRIETVTPTVLSAGNYQVDVKGNLVFSEAKPIPVLIRLSVLKNSAGQYQVTEQKDLSSTLSTAATNP